MFYMMGYGEQQLSSLQMVLCNVVQIEIKRSKVQVELEHGNFFFFKKALIRVFGRVFESKNAKIEV